MMHLWMVSRSLKIAYQMVYCGTPIAVVVAIYHNHFHNKVSWTASNKTSLQSVLKTVLILLRLIEVWKSLASKNAIE